MPLKPVSDLVHDAREKKYALGYFESWNFESLQGVLDAAEQTRSPIILGFNGDFNHCIIIRSFLSKNSTLYYQAGAGIVAGSVAESELKEVDNKIAALRKAIELAEEL